MSARTRSERQDRRERLLAVTVDSENDGRRLTIRVDRDDTVQHAVGGLYAQLGRRPDSDDSLRCAVRGEDVLFFAGVRLEEHLRHCPDLHWLFAAPAGGSGPL